MGKNKNNKSNIVYSTNKDFEFEIEEEQIETLPKQSQNLRVRMEKRNGTNYFVGTKRL